MGEYICEVVFLPGTSEEHRVKTKPIFVKGNHCMTYAKYASYEGHGDYAFLLLDENIPTPINSLS